MKNFIQDGNVLTLTAPYAVASGAAFKVGSIVAVATKAVGSGETVEGLTTGVVEVAKVSAQAWSVGAPIYWDDTAKLFTTTSTSNTLAGVATAVAANPSSVGRVRLNGHFS
jgi:predicted RecA/RadA family phage recombinase